MTKNGMANEVSDQQRLSRALETITDVLVSRKIEAVRASVTALDTKTSERLDSVKKEGDQASERLGKQLSSRFDELLRKLDAADDRHKTALKDADDRASKAEQGLKRELQDVQSKTDSRIRSLKDELGKNLTAKEESLKKELDALSAGLSSLQLELQEQLEKTERISTLLQGLATVFSGQPAMQPMMAAMPTQPTAAGEEDMDNALEQVFGADQGSNAEKPVQPHRDLEAPSGSSKKRR